MGDALWIQDYGRTAIFGMLGNFMSAFMVYLTWRSFSKEAPNVRSWKNLGLFVYAVCFSNLVCVWLLGIGLDLIAGTWYQSFLDFAWLNNVFFSMAFGLPLFIVLTSEKVWIYRGPLPENIRTLTKHLILIETVLMLVVYVCGSRGMHWVNNLPVRILSVIGAVILVVVCSQEIRDRLAN